MYHRSWRRHSVRAARFFSLQIAQAQREIAHAEKKYFCLVVTNRPLNRCSLCKHICRAHDYVHPVKSLESTSRFEEFYRQEVTALYRFVYSRIHHRDDALEIVQESFLTFYQLQQRTEHYEHERALLFRLARNRAMDWLRRQRTRERVEQDATVTNVLPFRANEPRTPEDLLLEKERQSCAAEALASLSERDQECLALRRSGLRYHEVADVLHVNPHSVGQLINRALRRFAETYETLLAGKSKSPKSNDEKETRRK